MKKEFDFENVPYHFTQCINHSCRRADSCLRHLVYAHASLQQATVEVINPRVQQSDGDNCLRYSEERMHAFALGITNLYNSLPHGIAQQLKSQLLSVFGKSKYYRFQRKERHLTPTDQKVVASIFERLGVYSTPQYDELSWQYLW